MTNIPKKYYFIILVLALLVLASYYNFQVYEPKKLKKIEEVKGAVSNDLADFPYPKNSERIGFNQTSGTKQTTFQTIMSAEEIQTFYKNVYQDKDWEIESETNNQNVLSSKYKKGQRLITVISTRAQDSEYTVVSIEISER